MKSLILALFLSFTGHYLYGQKGSSSPITFIKADSVAAIYKGENLENLPLLAYHLTAPFSTEIEKFRAIYTWVSTNVESDHLAYLRNAKKRNKFKKDPDALNKWNQTFLEKVFKTLLQEQKTVCTGYAYLLKELSTMASIECKIIDGYGRNISSNIGQLSIPNHSWNAVRINEKWFLCDATWSSGSYNLSSNKFIPYYEDGYFLTYPALFATNHYPLDSSWFLMEDTPSIEDFIHAPIIYVGAFKHQISPVYPTKLNIKIEKDQPITFLVKAPDSLNIEEFIIDITGINGLSKHTEVSRIEKDLVSIKYKFVIQGHYDVHLKVGQDIIMTYTIHVKK